MNQIILSGIQITISIWEMWMCYEILYMTVLDKKYADKKETIIRWANIFVVGSLLGINRLIAFFSRTMLGLTYSYQIKENSFLTCVSFFSNEDVS